MGDNQHGRTDLSSMVLKFDKRRYDGGSEIELIQYIENCYEKKPTDTQSLVSSAMRPIPYPATVSKEPKESGTNGVTIAPETLSSSVQQMGSDLRTNTKQGRGKQVLETLLLGPMEIAVGSVGILTSGLAIMTFSQVKNSNMVTQSKAVLKECTRTLLKGITDTLWAPIKAAKITLVGT